MDVMNSTKERVVALGKATTPTENITYVGTRLDNKPHRLFEALEKLTARKRSRAVGQGCIGLRRRQLRPGLLPDLDLRSRIDHEGG